MKNFVLQNTQFNKLVSITVSSGGAHEVVYCACWKCSCHTVNWLFVTRSQSSFVSPPGSFCSGSWPRRECYCREGVAHEYELGHGTFTQYRTSGILIDIYKQTFTIVGLLNWRSGLYPELNYICAIHGALKPDNSTSCCGLCSFTIRQSKTTYYLL